MRTSQFTSMMSALSSLSSVDAPIGAIAAVHDLLGIGRVDGTILDSRIAESMRIGLSCGDSLSEVALTLRTCATDCIW